MSLPLTPNTGTGLSGPLVTIAQYRKLTGDTTSLDADVTAAIADATIMVCKETRRTLAYGQYAENSRLYGNGMVFPSATPIDGTQAIYSGENLYDPAVDKSNVSIIQGAGIWIGFFTPFPYLPLFMSAIPAQTVYTYYGGYQPYQTASGPTEGLPVGAARLLTTTAFYQLNPKALTGLPGGVKSVSIGGISLSGDLSSFMEADPQLRRQIARLRKPMLRAWQN